MEILASALVALVAVEHLYILVMEMLLWQKAPGMRFHGFDADLAQRTAAMAANQGLYNGFLAAGLIWGLLGGGFGPIVFFLLCVAVAGIVGAITANRRILYIQTVPAILALIPVVLAH